MKRYLQKIRNWIFGIEHKGSLTKTLSNSIANGQLIHAKIPPDPEMFYLRYENNMGEENLTEVKNPTEDEKQLSKRINFEKDPRNKIES